MKFILKMIVIAGVFIISPSYAMKQQVMPFFSAGVGGGGDILIEHEYYNGTTWETEDVSAGSGLFVTGGVDVPLNNFSFLRGSVTYKNDFLAEIEGDVNFSRVPFELSLMLGNPRHRIGGGLAYHHNVRLRCRVDQVCNTTYHFDDELGFTAQYEFRTIGIWGDMSAFGLKYTDIEYKEKLTGQKVDGSGFDFYVSMFF
ncbi:hypothetical protein VA7868_01247 [Vibrio aerogenes CECT 7868]|uniref:Outer membrane protein beta-barrel domain-containing protein n=1 Tax=Vibrio aerogenes CECT 7868 TaxID=1216006 RepID=A0A1M5XPF1_9VIBR|nr:hypothetical protein [Vibrio aerogenes]SHI01705.1 hypothetical protein VA7868_01247 [Vibrio aerogenes CECT 7868]